MAVVHRHLREPAGGLLHGPLPQVAGVGEHVRLVHQGQLPARPLGGAPERVPDHPADAERGVDALLGGDLVRRAFPHDPAGAGVGTFGALPHHHDVDRLGPDVRQRRGHARIEPDRPQVDVVVQFEPQPQQQPALQHAAGHARVADRAEQDRIMPAQFVEHGVGQNLAGGVPAPGPEVVTRLLDHDIGGRRAQHLKGLGHDFGAYPVAADHGEPDGESSIGDARPAAGVPGPGAWPARPAAGAGGRPPGWRAQTLRLDPASPPLSRRSRATWTAWTARLAPVLGSACSSAELAG